MSSLLIRFFEFTRKRRPFFFIAVTLLVGIAAFFASKLQLNEDISTMMPKDPRIQKMNRIMQNSRFSDKLVLNIFLSDSLTESNPQLLVSFSDSLVRKFEVYQPEYIEKIRDKVSDQSMGNLFGVINENLPIFLTEDDYQKLDSSLSSESIDTKMESNYKLLVSPASLVLKKFVARDPLGIGGEVLKKLRNLQLEENFDLYEGRVMTKDRKNLLIFLHPSNPPTETARNSELLLGLDSTIVSLQEKFGNQVEAQYFGAAAVAAGNAQRIKNDLSLTITLAISILVIFLGLFFRRFEIVVVIFLPVAIGGVVSLAILYFLKHEVSAIALGMGSVLLGITVDYSLHIFTHFRSTGSVKSVLKDLPLPLMLSCLITAGSFLCLMFVKSEALNDLGLFAAISVINALLAGLIILPHFLKKPTEKVKAKTTNLSFIDKFTSYRYDKSRLLISMIIIVSVVSVFTSGHVKFETDMMKMNYVSDKLFEAEKNLLEISNVAQRSIYLVASGRDLEESLQANEKAVPQLERLQKEGVIKNSSGVGDFLISKRLQEKRIKAWENFWTEEKKESVRKNLLKAGERYHFSETAFTPFFQMLEKEYHAVDPTEMGELKNLFFDDFIAEKKDFTTVISILKVDESRKGELYGQIKESENLTILDRQYITSRFVELMRDDFNTLEVLSLGLVFLVLVISYGRLELGVIAFVPMALSWLWTLGVMGLLGIKFNIINIIISTFILGLGIDYSIFIMSGLIDEYTKGAKHLASYKTSIFLSAFTSITGIGALIFAEHPALKSVAALSIIGMCSVITISYCLQPLLFRKLISDRTSKGFKPYTAASLIYTFLVYLYFVVGCLLITVFIYLVFPLLPVSLSKKKKWFQKILHGFIWTQFHLTPFVKLKVLDRGNENFDKPSIIICNHQSFIDILIAILISPKIVIMTNDWVWNSPIFGRIVKYADFIPSSAGYESNMEMVEKKLKEGFSVLIYPEGTRSADGSIGRFHKGAFYLAEKLKVDILPLLIHGARDTIAKKDFKVNRPRMTLKFLPRIKPGDEIYGNTYQERARNLRKYYKTEYFKLKEGIETTEYLRPQVIKKFIYKGPVLEWYCRVKMKMENNYKLYDSILPKSGKILDIGCGYGFMSYMLAMRSENREILAIDYDSEKIEVAQNGFEKPDNLVFESGDVRTFEAPVSDAIIFSDVLHYLKPEEQKMVLEKSLIALKQGGILVIREGNEDEKEKHKNTRITEYFSTRLVGFNKTTNSLSFISAKELKHWLGTLGYTLDMINQEKSTSNSLFVVKKAGGTVHEI